jgi:polar amino acid transport system substrate-binding protein
VYAELNEVDSRLELAESGSRVAGNASELVAALLAKLGYAADIQIVPWARLMQNLENEPNVLGLNMTRTPEREALFNWVGEIRPVTFKLWGLRERYDELPKTLELASDYRISAYQNDVVEQHLLAKGFTNLVYVRENYNSFAMLFRGRIDYASFSEVEMDGYARQYELLKTSIVPIIDLEEISTAQYLVMSKTSEPELVRLVEEAFSELIISGERQRILNR